MITRTAVICKKALRGPLTLSAVMLLSIGTSEVRAQNYQPTAPRLPSDKTAQPSVAPLAPNTKNTADSPLIPVLNGLVFIDGSDQLKASGIPVPALAPSGIDVRQCPALNDRRFEEHLATFLGKPVLLSDLDRIKEQAAAWLRVHQRPFVDVSIPPQNVSSGVIQIVVTEYRLGKIKVQGARYFSNSLIRWTSGLVPDRTLRSDSLQTDLDRLNRNPFLNVNAVFNPGEQSGTTDVTLEAKDRVPVRVYSGYDNLGVRSLGVPEYNLGASWGNAFGTGQILSYQLTRTVSGRSISHSISDSISLPWGDQLLIFGSYQEQHPLLTQIFNDTGHSGQASVRYVRSLLHVRHFTQDIQVGYDFKTTDNNLAFAGLQVFSAQAEVDQFPLTYDANLTDHLGQTAIQNVFVYSPGRLTPGNTTAALSALVPGSTASYFYDRFLITRTTVLPKGISAITRFTVQGSDHNLPYSEQVGGGGVGSVRGYYTDTALGSEGEMLSQEMRLPAFGLVHLFDRDSEHNDKAQFGVFFDYAHLRQVSRVPDVANSVNLASAGVLARYSFSRMFDLQFDFGWRLEAVPTVPNRGAYGQTSITASF